MLQCPGNTCRGRNRSCLAALARAAAAAATISDEHTIKVELLDQSAFNHTLWTMCCDATIDLAAYYTKVYRSKSLTEDWPRDDPPRGLNDRFCSRSGKTHRHHDRSHRLCEGVL